MFTYPIVSPGGYLSSEYFLLSGFNGSVEGAELAYYYIDLNGATVIATKNINGVSSNEWVTSDGTYVIHQGSTTAGKSVKFCGWDGATGFTPTVEADTQYFYYNLQGMCCNPNYPGVIFSPGNSVNETASNFYTYDPVTPSFTHRRYLEHPSNSRNGADYAEFRAQGAPKTYGNRFVWPAWNGPGVFIVKDIGTTGATTTATGYTAGWQGGSAQNGGFDRDYNRLFRIGTGVVTVATVDFSAETITSTSVMTGEDLTSIYGVTGFEGIVILLGEKSGGSDWIQSYSLSGTTLTKLDEYSLGNLGNTNNSQLVTSPYTGWVYSFAGVAGASGVFRVDKSSGAITRIDTLGFSNSAGTLQNNFHFLGETPLPDLS